MGNSFSIPKIEDRLPTAFSRKRKREETDDEEANLVKLKNEQDSLSTAKRRRHKSTAKYIYQTLFLEGQGSDVTIHALGKEWHLHKIYLSQCAYFSSMFSGSWAESSLKSITVNIPDDIIDETALKITFGSLYTDSVFIKPVDVNKILAAANLFQLDGLIQQCVWMMKEKISSLTVCSYYQAANLYGKEEVKSKCLSWLEENLLKSQTASLLADISPELMLDLVSSSTLFVVQVEMNIYNMLKRWMFLQLSENQSWRGSLSDLDKEANSFYSSLTEKDTPCHFLETSQGQPFLSVFKVVRWQHIVCDISSLRVLQQDRIFPTEWLQPILQYQWINMLQVDQGFDNGPPNDVSEEDFEDLCVRCGRVLDKDTQFCWRWTGFSFGFDLIMSYANRVIGIKRNTRKENCPNAVGLQDQRRFLFRLTVSCFDELGKLKYRQATGIQHMTLGPDEEKLALLCDLEMEFPVHLNLNLLLVTPAKDIPKPDLAISPLLKELAVNTSTEPGSPPLLESLKSNWDSDRVESELPSNSSETNSSTDGCSTVRSKTQPLCTVTRETQTTTPLIRTLNTAD